MLRAQRAKDRMSLTQCTANQGRDDVRIDDEVLACHIGQNVLLIVDAVEIKGQKLVLRLLGKGL